MLRRVLLRRFVILKTFRLSLDHQKLVCGELPRLRLRIQTAFRTVSRRIVEIEVDPMMTAELVFSPEIVERWLDIRPKIPRP